LKDKIEGKEIKRMRDDYACEGEKSKNKENEEKTYYLYQGLGYFGLD
jgi:hypothetical protein